MTDGDRRAYLRAGWMGALPAIVLFAAVLAMNGIGFHGNEYTTAFHTEQMRRLLHLHWDMSPDVLLIEGFRRGHHWYMYYGPFPSLFRLPFIVLWPDRADRITQWSMLVGFVVALRAVGRLLWRGRRMLGVAAAPSRRELLGAGAFVFLVGAGSSLLFLGSDAWIYHETEVWGAALALSAYEAIIGVVEAPDRRRVLVAGAWTAAAILTRGSVGVGPVASLGLIGIASLSARLRPWVGLRAGATRRVALGMLAAAVVPFVMYSAVNYARFANPIVFPTSAQRMSQINPQRIHFLAHSGGSYFGLQFVPTTAWQYLRPDALHLGTFAPFIDFPTHNPVVGSAVFDAIEPTSSIPSSMPALTVLAIFGFVALVGASRRRVAWMRAPVVGALIGGAAVLPFGYIANRYLADFVPLLVLLAVVGFHVLAGPRAVAAGEERAASREDDGDTRQPRRRGRVRRVAVAGIVVLGVLSVFTNAALAVSYHYTGPWAPEHIGAPFLADAIDLHRSFPGGEPAVRRVTTLPLPAGPRGTIAVVGDCAGVYWSGGNFPSLAWSPWRGVERTEAAGRYDFDVTFPSTPPPRGAVEPLVIRGEPGRLQTLAVIYGQPGQVRFGFTSQDHAGLPRGPVTPDGFAVGKIVPVRPGRTMRMTVVMDPNNGQVRVDLDGRVAYRFFRVELTPAQNSTYVFPTSRVAFGTKVGGVPTGPAFTGRLERRPTPPPTLCRRLVAGSH
ncbi:MAG: hypothetical protein ACXVJ7_15345 [Acidimicrobiia bacterium]